MANATYASRAARAILVATALLLPTLSLLPLGGLYLWEKGYLLWWAIAAFFVIAVIAMLQRRLLASDEVADAAEDALPRTPGDPAWKGEEQRAWDDVTALGARADTGALADPQALLDLGLSTVEAVARRLHPEKHDAVWQFTLPEALAISERVSRRLGTYVHSHIPFGDRLTLAQFWAVYRWRGALDVAERAYDVWRLVRLANPATALTHEARERLSKALVKWGREHVERQLVAAFVEEVGRAAIDLYGGRLRIAGGGPSAAAPSTADASDIEQAAPGENERAGAAAPTAVPRPRGWLSAGRQAASATFALGRAVLRRRGGNRTS